MYLSIYAWVAFVKSQFVLSDFKVMYTWKYLSQECLHAVFILCVNARKFSAQGGSVSNFLTLYTS